MSKDQILSQLLESRLVAIIRLDDPSEVYPVSCAIAEGGITSIEVTMTTPNALNEIQKLSQKSGVLVGVGSVVDAKTARAAIDSGAEYIVTPVSKKAVIEASHALEKPIISGAFTPSEVVQAYDWGADIIKLFPADQFGIGYLKAIRAPLPHIPIFPTGGINADNARAWLDAGALGLGIGSALVDKELIAQKDYKAITQKAKALVAALG